MTWAFTCAFFVIICLHLSGIRGEIKTVQKQLKELITIEQSYDKAYVSNSDTPIKPVKE